MAHWIYINPSSSATIGSSNTNSLYGDDQYDNIIVSKYIALSGEVTGFPLYTSQVGEIFTQSKPASGLLLRSGDASGAIYDEYWASIIAAYDSEYYRIIDSNVDEGLYDQSISMYNHQILPNKLFRVDDTAFDSHSIIYTDVPIFGSFRINKIDGTLPQGCLVPISFTVNGETYEGIGNYNSSYFSYKVKPDKGSWDSNGSGGANLTRSFLTSKTGMTPKYLKRQADSNKLVLTDIQVGDVLEFGPLPQRVPSVFKEWIISNSTDIGSIRIDLPSSGGIELLTKEKVCPWNIKVIPKLEDVSVAVSQTSQIIRPSDGFAGIGAIAVEAIQLEEKAIDITENGSINITPDAGKDGLSKVTITTNAIPAVYDEEAFTLTKEG